jgi:hypothetical protein
VDGTRCQVELADVGYITYDRTWVVGSFLVQSSGQFGEALLLQDHTDRRRAERLVFAGEGTADIVDGKILFPERDDLVSQPFLLARGPYLLGRREKELAPGLIAKLMDKDPKTSWSISEAGGRLRRGDTLNEKRPEGLVLAMSRVGRLEEPTSWR